MTLRPCAGNRWIRDHLTEVTSSCPSVIVLHINLGSLPASEVVGEILQLAWDLRRDYRCPVYVTQLLAWLCHSPERLLDVEEINTELLHTWPRPYFWRHLGCGAVILTCSMVFTLVPAARRNTTRVSVPVLAGPFATSRQ